MLWPQLADSTLVTPPKEVSQAGSCTSSLDTPCFSPSILLAQIAPFLGMPLSSSSSQAACPAHPLQDRSSSPSPWKLPKKPPLSQSRFCGERGSFNSPPPQFSTLYACVSSYLMDILVSPVTWQDFYHGTHGVHCSCWAGWVSDGINMCWLFFLF